MNVCSEKGLIKAKIGKKLEIIFYQNKFRSEKTRYLKDGLSQLVTLLINSFFVSQQTDLAKMAHKT
jgi:hypothetical protein